MSLVSQAQRSVRLSDESKIFILLFLLMTWNIFFRRFDIITGKITAKLQFTTVYFVINSTRFFQASNVTLRGTNKGKDTSKFYCNMRWTSPLFIKRNFFLISRCSVCDKGFPHQTALTSHMSVHSTTRPHKCTVCGKSYKNYSTLQAHSRLHITEDVPGLKKFLCNICGKR